LSTKFRQVKREMGSLFEIAPRKKLFFRLVDRYYAPEIVKEDPGFDAVYYFYCQEPYKHCQKRYTAIVDLKREEEEILRSFRKRYREVINKMLKDENLEISVIDKPKKTEMDEFMQNYQEFTRQKGFSQPIQQRLNRLHEHGRLILLNATYEGDRLLQKVLMKDSKKFIFFLGYTTRLQEDDHDKIKIISAINKTVEYHCMLYAKNNGLDYYDLGGLFEDPENPSGVKVDHYKDGYKGENMTEYDFIYPLTWKGQLFCRLKRMHQFMAQKKKEFIRRLN
jgi:lipid II:glycine glycyltransferase (peptidoglycan interpeptide bridge formation enzyme)